MTRVLSSPSSVTDPPQHVACTRCGGDVTFTPDAIGRMRERCPRCDRVGPAPRITPGEVRGPQLLPSIEPGQLRCQGCGRGVDGQRARFCPRCVVVRAAPRPRRSLTFAPKPCGACGRSFTPTGGRAMLCRTCKPT